MTDQGQDPEQEREAEVDRDEEERREVDLDVETPEADAAEQRADWVPEDDEPPAPDPVGRADPADAAEQRRVVGQDEDDYR
jgi:hypothetical protein